jgi:hypothetical protein
MDDPYRVLNLAEGASDQQIRARYLELVRQYPPESAPDRFAEIRAAYDEISNPHEQIKRMLFFPPKDSIDDIIHDLKSEGSERRVATDDLLALGRDPC